MALLAFTGCDRLKSVMDRKPDAAVAQKRVRDGDYRGGVEVYESLLDGTPKSADMHFSLALLYEKELEDPYSAVHHFGRYLNLAPAGARAKDAQAAIAQCRFKISSAMVSGPLVSQQEAVHLKNENQRNIKVIAELQAQVKSLRAAASSAGVGTVPQTAKGEPARKVIPPGARMHTVGPGETLGSIAAKYYKNKARWKEIQEANFQHAEGTVKIKPGQELYIP